MARLLNPLLSERLNCVLRFCSQMLSSPVFCEICDRIG